MKDVAVANSSRLRSKTLQPPNNSSLVSNRDRAFGLLLGVLLSSDNLPGIYHLAGLTTGSPALPLLILLSVTLRPSGLRAERLLSMMWVGVLCFGIFSIVISLLIYGIDLDVFAFTIGPDTVVVKAIKTFLIVLFWLLAVRVGYRLALHNPVSLIWVGIGLTSINLAALILQITGIVSSGSVDQLHAVGWHDDRPRGLKFESSVFGASIIAGIALIGINSPAKITWGFLVPLCLVMTYLSSSRGALIAAIAGPVIVLAGIFIYRACAASARWIFGAFLVASFVAASLLGFYLTTSTAWEFLASRGSDATRSGWGLVALESLGHPPLGLNAFNYWLEVRELVAQVNMRLHHNFQALDLREFTNLTTSSSDSGLSPKSLLALMTVWFGLPGLVVCAWTLVKGVSGLLPRIQISGVWGAVGVTSTVVALTTFVPGIFFYESAIVLGCALAFGTSMKRGSESAVR